MVSKDNRWLGAEKIFTNAITIWDIAKRQEQRTLPKMESTLIGVAFSENGKLVGGLSKNGEIVVWEVDSGNEVKRIQKEGANLSKEVESVACAEQAVPPKSDRAGG